MHRNHPQRRIEVRTKGMIFGNMCFPHTTGFSQMAISYHYFRNAEEDPSDKIVHNVSEPSPTTVGALLCHPEWNPLKPANNNSRSDNSIERRTKNPGAGCRGQNRINRPCPGTNTC